MHELEDNALLQEYVNHNSEAAFATLIERHINKVYSAALRHTNNPHHAEEITQAVFVIFARKASQLKKEVSLSGWLYQTARFTAVTFIRSEIRRTRRENDAQMQVLLNETESDVWPQIAPLLDTAMAKLTGSERHAIVLRFFDGKSMKEVGSILGTNENAAKKRVGRAIEKLRAFFGKRGVVVPAAALVAAISTNSVQAAPATLAKSVSAITLTKGVMAGGSIAVLVKGALNMMTLSKIKAAIFVGVLGLAFAGGSTIAIEKLMKQFEQTPGGAIYMGAAKFVKNLKLEGRLPGIESNTPVGLEIPGIYFDRPGGSAHFAKTNFTFPVSLTLTVHVNLGADLYKYTVTKATGTNEWQLQQAWHFGTNGTVPEQLSVH